MAQFERKLAALPLVDLILDPRLQMRQKINRPHVEDLMEVAKKLRVKVRVVDGGNYVTDGFHSVLAAKKKGEKAIPCELKPGTWEEALLDATSANQHSSLKRTVADRRRAIEETIKLKPNWSDREVAEHVGATHPTVAVVRTSLNNEVVNLPPQKKKKAMKQVDFETAIETAIERAKEIFEASHRGAPREFQMGKEPLIERLMQCQTQYRAWLDLLKLAPSAAKK